MGVIRIQHNNNYTVMANWHLRDKQLSLKAKGLMSYMLSLPDDWDYSINGLAYVCNCGRDMIRSGLVELEALGYLQRDRHRNACGQLVNTDYILYEHPRLQNTIVSEQTKHNQDKLPELKKPRLEKPRLEKPTLDFPIQLNTNISNNVYKQVLSAATGGRIATVDNAIALATEIGVAGNAIERCIKKYGVNVVYDTITLLKSKCKEGYKIGNPAAMLSTACKEAWISQENTYRKGNADCSECHGTGRIMMKVEDTGAEISVLCQKCMM